MSYIVLARKYRPRTFSELVGQAHVVQALTNALTQQRLHHAYMFNGTRGVGKTTISRILAKSLNCQGADGQGGITATPCGVCHACTEIDAGVFVDYTELDAASNRGVDEVQTLLEQSVYKPVQGRFKVFMIDEVHMLTNTAFNAMLKTLEEPPEYLKFVLATTDPQKVPVTVLSRCLQFNLRPMAPDTVFTHLTHVLQAESIPAEAPALRLLARAARGSMRDALSLADQAIAFGSGKLEEAAVRQMLGSVDSTSVFTLIDALAAGDARTVIETVDALRAYGLSADTTLEDMSSVLQRMAVLQAVPQMAQEPDASDPDAAAITRLAQQMPADETQLLYSICLRGRADLGLAPDEYAALTMVLLRLLAFKPASNASPAQTPPEAEKKNSALTERPASHTPADAVRTESPAPVSSTTTALPAAPLSPVEQNTQASRQADAHTATDPAAQNRTPLPWEDDAPASSAQTAAPASADATPQPHSEWPQASEPSAIQALPTHPPAIDTADADSESRPLQAAENSDGDFWHATVQQLIRCSAITAMPRELALHSQLVQRTENHLLLRVQRETLAQPGICARLQQALAAAGITQRLGVQSGNASDTPAIRNASAARAAQRAAEQCVAGNALVQELIQEWDATIVPGSIRPL